TKTQGAIAFSLADLPAGTHTLEVTVTDATNQSHSDPVTLRVAAGGGGDGDNAPPAKDGDGGGWSVGPADPRGPGVGPPPAAAAGLFLGGRASSSYALTGTHTGLGRGHDRECCTSVTPCTLRVVHCTRPEAAACSGLRRRTLQLDWPDSTVSWLCATSVADEL